MNARRHQISVLQQIVEVRHLQEKRQEQAFADAALAARKARHAELTAEERLAQRQEAWLQAVRRDRLDPYLADAFNQAVLQADQALIHAKSETATAEAWRDERSLAFQHAEAETQAAEQIHDGARHLHRRKLEEARLNEVSDSAARRRPRP